MSCFSRTALWLVILLIFACELWAQAPQAPESHPEPAVGLEFKLLKIFPGKNGLLTGRFKLTNGSADIVTVWGQPSSMMEIIGLSPSQDVSAYATFVRLNETEKNDWITIPKPPNAAPIKALAYELYSGEIRYLDLLLPNASNKPKAELLVQLYLQLGEAQYHLNSSPFKLQHAE